jgi:hypothetical protein
MDDIKTLVVRNEMGLPKEQVDKLSRLLANRTVTYLSPDKEAGAFLLYSIGRTLPEIATQLSIPPEVIILTALQYKWQEKAILLQSQEGGLKTLQDLQKDLASSILVATLLTAQKELGDLIAGRIKPSECAWLPRNMQSLEKLMNMINNLNPVAPAVPAPAPTVVHAQNVQINQNAATHQPSDTMDRAKKIEYLEAMAREKQ